MAVNRTPSRKQAIISQLTHDKEQLEKRVNILEAKVRESKESKFSLLNQIKYLAFNKETLAKQLDEQHAVSQEELRQTREAKEISERKLIEQQKAQEEIITTLGNHNAAAESRIILLTAEIARLKLEAEQRAADRDAENKRSLSESKLSTTAMLQKVSRGTSTSNLQTVATSPDELKEISDSAPSVPVGVKDASPNEWEMVSTSNSTSSSSASPSTTTTLAPSASSEDSGITVLAKMVYDGTFGYLFSGAKSTATPTTAVTSTNAVPTHSPRA